jgi:hypothetical protein
MALDEAVLLRSSPYVDIPLEALLVVAAILGIDRPQQAGNSKRGVGCQQQCNFIGKQAVCMESYMALAKAVQQPHQIEPIAGIVIERVATVNGALIDNIGLAGQMA